MANKRGNQKTTTLSSKESQDEFIPETLLNAVAHQKRRHQLLTTTTTTTTNERRTNIKDDKMIKEGYLHAKHDGGTRYNPQKMRGQPTVETGHAFFSKDESKALDEAGVFDMTVTGRCLSETSPYHLYIDIYTSHVEPCCQEEEEEIGPIRTNNNIGFEPKLPRNIE